VADFYAISPANVAFFRGAQGCDFLRKSQLVVRGFGTHPKEKCLSRRFGSNAREYAGVTQQYRLEPPEQDLR
jgi:hypothetical protein